MSDVGAGSRRPCGPPWHSRLGHFLGWAPDKLGFLRDCTRRYGDVVDLSLAAPLQSTYLLNDPEDIGHVLQDHRHNYEKTPKLTGRAGRRRSGEGLLTGTGEPAIARKRLLQPLLAQSAAERFAPIVVRCARERMARWRVDAELDLAAEMIALARQIMGEMLLGIDLEGEGRELGRQIERRQRCIEHVYTSLLPLAERLPLRANREHRRAIRSIDESLYGMIAERRASASAPRDLLGLLVQARHADGTTMSDKQVRDEALTITSTGYETVGLALAWSLYLLSRHAGVERRLGEEVRAALGERPPAAGDEPKLRYAGKVFSEALRLYPPVWIFVRIPQRDDVLPSGTRVRAGTRLYLCPYVTQRDPRFFPDPERFDPDRFAEPAPHSRPRLAYFPFAGGPRVCLGQGFALLEGVLVLSCIAQRFTLEPVPGPSVTAVPRQFLFPSRPIRVRPRPCLTPAARTPLDRRRA
jgi:cytochrome P450